MHGEGSNSAGVPLLPTAVVLMAPPQIFTPPPLPPQCELYHWVDLLDRFDGILAEAGRPVENMSWMLACDRPEREQLKALLLALLNFTALLIEYSFSRHLYSSIEVPDTPPKPPQTPPPRGYSSP